MTKKARLIVIAAILAAFGALALGTLVGETGTGRCLGQPAEVESVSPACNAAALQRDPVEADLAPGFEGELIINDQAVPVERIAALNVVRYRPSVGRELERLPAQVNIATVIYWPTALGRDQAKRFSWTFRVN